MVDSFPNIISKMSGYLNDDMIDEVHILRNGICIAAGDDSLFCCHFLGGFGWKLLQQAIFVCWEIKLGLELDIHIIARWEQQGDNDYRFYE